jgi:hypothetical protein
LNRLILQWSSLSYDEKLDKYSKNASHELNFFLHSKDKDFFGSVAKIAIQQKLEKSSIDMYLLGIDEPSDNIFVQQSLSLIETHFEKTNKFEKALLFKLCLQKGSEEQKETVRNIMKIIISGYDKANRSLTQEQKDQHFDQVL